MGKFILCEGPLAKNPYHFNLTNTNVYSLEELGYYLYHNIYTISLKDFGQEFFEWVKNDLNREDLVEKWTAILNKSQDIKDIVISILCATDYFSKLEVESMVKTIDMINGLSPIGKKKIKADNYLRYQDYDHAAKEYEEIIYQDAANEFSAHEFGNILHNLAVAHIQLKALERAEKEFKEAYSLNKNEESLKEYLFLLKLQKKEQDFVSEALNYGLSPEKTEEYKNELEQVLLEAESDPDYKKIANLPKLKEEGKVGDYYYTIDTMIFNWKQKYKQGMERS